MPVTRAVGMRLARNIPAVDPQQMPLLRANATLNERYARALADAGIQSVWVHDDLSDGIEPRDLVSPAVRERSARAVSKAIAGARRAVASGRRLSPEALAELHRVVDDIADSVAQHPGASVVLDDLAAADAYTHQHSIDVCALGLLLGRELFSANGWQDDRGRRRFDDIDRRLHLLGLGLLVHDVGKLLVPAEILNKPGRLTDEEMAIMRTHPDLGADLLADDAYSPLVRAVIREHHERWDGGGYPKGLSGRHIHQLARIAAVADVYDAVTSERPYHPARPPYKGVEVILDGAGAAFDPEVVEVFRRVVHPYPIGSELRLPDGEVGVVARIDPEHPDCPWVRFPAGERPVDTEVELAAA
ncbi:MAG TPA: HD domain-containing phosphohydrolase [Solirubrobacteraceae bacterium]